MVLTTRAIDPVTVNNEAYSKSINQVLECVAAEKLVGLLKQIGQISDFAADIFSNLFKDASATHSRIELVSNRINHLEGNYHDIDNEMSNSNPEKFYSNLNTSTFIRKPRTHEQLFTLENMPEPIARVRQSAQSPPQVAALDDFAGKKCLASYSDPDLFFNLWLKEEEARLAKLQEENKAKRANKKKKKKVEPKQQKTVAAVQIKSYSAQGKEFETVANPNASVNLSGSELPTQSEVDDAGDDEETGSLATFNMTQTHIAKPYQQQQQEKYQVPNAPDFGAPPPIPQFNSSSSHSSSSSSSSHHHQHNNNNMAPTAPPMAPVYDTPVSSAPVAPPLSMMPDPNAPMAPPMDIPSISSNSSTRGGGLLGQIQGGVQLRRAEAVSKTVDARGGLLGEIRNRTFQLKRVDKDEEKAKAEAADKGGLSSIMAVLARRQAIANESDEEDGEAEGEDWE